MILFTNFNVLLKNVSSKIVICNKKSHPLIAIKITLTFDCYIRLFVHLTVVNKQITQIIWKIFSGKFSHCTKKFSPRSNPFFVKLVLMEMKMIVMMNFFLAELTGEDFICSRDLYRMFYISWAGIVIARSVIVSTTWHRTVASLQVI